MAGLSVLRTRLGILLALALAVVTLAGVTASSPPPPWHPADVGLAGSPHLWFTDADGLLHWGGDTRALAGREINWNNRIEISRGELCALPADRLGDPWLSAGLLKQGDPIYLVKWESDWAQPKLLHIRSIRDVEVFGINERNYGKFVLDVATWEARYGFSVADLERGVLEPACAPPYGHPAVIGLAGSPHLWFTDVDELLHWGGDTRALAGREIPWGNRSEISWSELCGLPAYQFGDPWLSAGLLKQGDPIYLVKWETEWAQPKLLHIQAIRDVEAFGINERNYGDFIFDVPTWEARYGFSVADLERGVLAPACAPPPPPPPPPARADGQIHQ